MATHTGISTGTGELRYAAKVTTFQDVVPYSYDFLTCWPDTPQHQGDKTNVQAVQPVDNKPGRLSPDYADLWYDHIHILPNRINVGNLTSQQVRPIEIFNGYFSSKTLNTVAATGLSGVDF
jgi:hypothetical protein